LLGLRHYLNDAQTLEEIVKGVLTMDPPFLYLVKSPHQPATPTDLARVVRKGMSKDPNDRYQTVSELLERLRARQEGHIPIECPVTFTMTGINALARLVDHHPLFTLVATVGTGVAALGGLVYGALHLLGVA
jgi:eukaryotic-like serine/threonine-protein kinase